MARARFARVSLLCSDVHLVLFAALRSSLRSLLLRSVTFVASDESAQLPAHSHSHLHARCVTAPRHSPICCVMHSTATATVSASPVLHVRTFARPNVWVADGSLARSVAVWRVCQPSSREPCPVPVPVCASVCLVCLFRSQCYCALPLPAARRFVSSLLLCVRVHVRYVAPPNSQPNADANASESECLQRGMTDAANH